MQRPALLILTGDNIILSLSDQYVSCAWSCAWDEKTHSSPYTFVFIPVNLCESLEINTVGLGMLSHKIRLILTFIDTILSLLLNFIK